MSLLKFDSKVENRYIPLAVFFQFDRGVRHVPQTASYLFNRLAALAAKLQFRRQPTIPPTDCRRSKGWPSH